MNDSILTSIKKLLGITEEYTHFDADIMMYINGVFINLTQLGIGPSNGFKIENAGNTWDEYIDDPNSDILLSAVKTYIYLKVKLIFDPPLNSSVMESIKQQINELEWRLNMQVESE